MKKIFFILLILILLLTALLFISKKERPAAGGMLILKWQTTQAEVNLANFTRETVSTKPNPEKKIKSEYKVVPLKTILEAQHINIADFSELIFYSGDGMAVTISAAESDGIFLTEEVSADKSYLRLIIPSDEFPQRWLKYVSLIELK